MGVGLLKLLLKFDSFSKNRHFVETETWVHPK